MRKILPKKEAEANEGRKRTIIVSVLAVIMLLSTAGYSFMGFGKNSNKKEYRGVKFELMEDGWHFKIQEFNFVTSYLPEETENISAGITLNAQNYYGKPMYFSKESRQEGIREIEKNIQQIASRMQYACLDNNCTDYAMKNCTSDNIISIEEKNETFIRQEGNCIIISSPYGETARASDRFLFKIIGLN